MRTTMTMDDGVQFGLGAFETIAVERGKGILLSRHLARLGRSAQFLGLGDLAERGLTMERAAEWIGENCPEHSACKILLTQENLMMRLRPNPYGPARYARGFRMDFSAVRRNETSPLTGHKTLNYGDCILEHRAAAAAGMDERIFLNMRGKLAEGTVSNLFLVSGGRIYTPALSCGLLPGVLRSYLLERYRVEEGEIDPRELENFDECFVTNSLMGVMPVQQLGERVFPSRETVDRLRSAYEAEKGTLQQKSPGSETIRGEIKSLAGRIGQKIDEP